MPSNHTNLSRGEFLLGIVLLLFVVALWTISSFLTNAILTGHDDDETTIYNKPFLVTWLCTSSFSFYLVRPLVLEPLLRRWRPQQKQVESHPSYSAIPAVEGEPAVNPSDKLDTRQTAYLGLQFCAVWFAANYSLNAALALTAVSSTTIMSSTSGFFTLALGHILGLETFSLLKLTAVIASIIGVSLVTKGDSEAESQHSLKAPLLGDALALLSALLYAGYVSLLKLRVGDESRISMPLFFGFVGIINVFLLWPFGVILHFTGIERFEWPSGNALIIGLLINAAITFVSDFVYLIAMLKTSPLTVTLGMSLTIPCAIVGDILEGNNPRIFDLIGAGIIIIAFVIVGLADHKEASEEIEA